MRVVQQSVQGTGSDHLATLAGKPKCAACGRAVDARRPRRVSERMNDGGLPDLSALQISPGLKERKKDPRLHGDNLISPS